MAEAKEKKSDSAARSDGGASSADGGKAETKFAAFVQSKKLDLRRIVAASYKLETLQPEDRAIKLRKRRARAAEGGENAPKETAKPRSGRPVTDRAIHAALVGKPVSGPTKTRLLRAVNVLLGQKKQPEVDLRALF